MEELKEGWRRVKLGEVAEYINNKIDTSELNENNYISTENMIVDRGGITTASNIPKNVKVNYFKKNDILFSNIRTYFKKLWKSDFNGGASNDVLIIRSLNSQKILNDYLYYILSEKNFFDYTINTSKGTKMPRGDKSAILRYEFLIPEDIKTQEKIASVLAALDDKIEVNNEMNKTLEEMAQTLFKRWFIDFDFPNENEEPYKSSGGKMIDSELGEIPEGWRIGNLEEIVNISSGKRPKVKKEKDKLHKIPIIGANGVMSYTNEFMYNEKLLTIGRVGTLGVVQKYYDKIWPSDNSLVIKSDYLEMIYFILKNVDYKSLNRGSTQPLITQTDMKNLKIIIGETELILEFCKIIFKLFDFQRKNYREIQSLTEIRDALLPKLMNGEIEV